MAKNKVELGCNQTRGSFVIKGKITGRFSNNFYSEGTGQNGKPWRKVHFGVELEPGHTVYCDMFGAVNDYVYASKNVRGADGKNKNETQQVPWDRRFDIGKTEKYKGFKIIGVTCGCKKKIDEKNGMEVNDVRYLSMYDACDEVGNLHDGDSVFVRGTIQYSTYNDQHRVNFEPQQISLCKPIDFEDMEYVPEAHFTQPIVLMGVEKNEEASGEAVVTAKIINYQSIEDTEFYTKNAALAKNLKKLKDYCYIETWGDIVVETGVEEAPVNDGWGDANSMNRITSPAKRKLYITGANPDSIDKESHSEDVIEHALEVIAGIQSAKNDYGKKDENEWGAKSGSNFDEDEDDDSFDLGI